MHIEHSSKKSRFFASGGGSAPPARPPIAKAKATPHAMRSNMPGIRCLVHRRIEGLPPMPPTPATWTCFSINSEMVKLWTDITHDTVPAQLGSDEAAKRKPPQTQVPLTWQRNRQQWHPRRRNAKNATHSKASARQGQKSHIATPREATYGGSNHLGEIPMPLLRGQHRKHNQEWHGQRRRPLWQTISRPQRTSLSRTDARVPQVRRKGTVSTRPWPNQMQPQETQWKSLLNHALVC